MYYSVSGQTPPPCIYDRFASQYRTNQQWNNLLDKACSEMNSNKYRDALKTLDKAMYIDSIANIGDYTKDAYISMIQTKIRRYLTIVDEVEIEKSTLIEDDIKKQAVNSEKYDSEADMAVGRQKKRSKSKREKYYYQDDEYTDTFVNTKQESTDVYVSKKSRKEKAEGNPDKKKNKVDKKAALIAVPVIVETITIVKDIDASEKKTTIKEDKKGLLKKFSK